MPLLDIEIKVDHPDKVAQVAGIPTKYYIESKNFNETVNAINQLDERLIATSVNRILVNNGFIIEGTVFILNALSEWLIFGLRNKNTEEVRRNIDLSQAGLVRRDAVILKSNDVVEILKGNEVVSFPTLPQIPDDAIVLTDFPVTDSAIGAPTLPIIGETFFKKMGFGEIIFTGSGVTAILMDAELGGLRFEGANTTFESVLCYNESALFVGKPFYIKNAQSIEMSIKNLIGLGYKFNCPDGIDLVAQPKETLPWEWRKNNDVWYLEYVGKINHTGQKLVMGNVVLDNSYNGKIVKIKANCTITIPSNLKKDFNCVFRTFSTATANFVEGSGTNAIDAPNGKIMEPFKMATLFKDGSLNAHILEGGLKL